MLLLQARKLRHKVRDVPRVIQLWVEPGSKLKQSGPEATLGLEESKESPQL